MANCTDIKIYKDGAWRSIKYKKMYASGAWRNANNASVCYNGTWYSMPANYLNVNVEYIEFDQFGQLVSPDGDFTIDTNENWTIVKTIQIILIPTALTGSGVTTKSVRMNFNKRPDSFNGTIKITTASGLSAFISVIQWGGNSPV